MLLQHLRIFDVVQIRIHDRVSVQRHLDVPPVGGYLFRVPFSGRLLESVLGRHDFVDRPVILPRLELSAIPFVLVIQNLNLHPNRRGAALEWSADADAVVASR